MKNHKTYNTEKDILKASRRAAREEEISLYEKQVAFRPSVKKSKKVYDHKNLSKQ